MAITPEFITDISQVSEQQWDSLIPNGYPFIRHRFLFALESSGAVCAESGWQPQHLLLYQDDELVGALPLYLKTHSYGEYVFDWAWAEAYQRHGLRYYPKLLSAIPFTPVTGPRLLLKYPTRRIDLGAKALEFIKHRAKQLHCSSVHWLFNPDEEQVDFAAQDFLTRHSVQFQWFNRGYSSFDDFLATFVSRKRKSVKKERRKIIDAGIQVRRYVGADVSPELMQHFYRCYQQTYLKRSGHQGYLGQSFFEQLQRDFNQHLMLTVAFAEETPVASALYFFDQDNLYGRYWGALQESDGLHFECCYYQGIEFCIEQTLKSFNPGTQGEHKIMRGFEPITCYSQHWLAQPEFHSAVEQFLGQEREHIYAYRAEAAELLPYKTLKD